MRRVGLAALSAKFRGTAPSILPRLSATMSRRKRILLRIALVWISLEVVCGLALLVASKGLGLSHDPIRLELTEPQRENVQRLLGGEFAYTAHHPVTGWAPPPNANVGLYQTNSQGIRSRREFPRRRSRGTSRIAAFGDSFTHCDDVTNTDAWPALVDKELPHAEVLNFGVPAFGPDQAWLRYRDLGRKFRPDVVLIGMMSENINRVINVFRPFYSASYQMVLTKPRYLVIAGDMVLAPNPLPSVAAYRSLLDAPEETLERIGANDGHFNSRSHEHLVDLVPSARFSRMFLDVLRHRFGSSILPGTKKYRANSEAYRVADEVLRGFYAQAEKDSARAVIVFLPNLADIERARQDPATTSYTELLQGLSADGLRVLDLAPTFTLAKEDLVDLVTGPWKHYSPRGNRLVAAAVADYLREQELDGPRRR